LCLLYSPPGSMGFKSRRVFVNVQPFASMTGHSYESPVGPPNALGTDVAAAPQSADRARLRNLLRSHLPHDVPAYRAAHGGEMPVLQSRICLDSNLNRILTCVDDDPKRGAKWLVETLEWRRRVFPIARVGSVATVLDDGRRLRVLGANGDDKVCIQLDFLWNMEDDLSQSVLLQALILFLEEVLDAEDAASGAQRKLCVAIVRGYPPAAFLMALQKMFGDHYSCRLDGATLYPIQPLCGGVLRVCMNAVLTEDSKGKLGLASSEAQFLASVKLNSSQLPVELRGGYTDVLARDMPEARPGREVMATYLSFRMEQATALLQSVQRDSDDVASIKMVHASQGSNASALVDVNIDSEDKSSRAHWFCGFGWDSLCVSRPVKAPVVSPRFAGGNGKVATGDAKVASHSSWSAQVTDIRGPTGIAGYHSDARRAWERALVLVVMLIAGAQACGILRLFVPLDSVMDLGATF